MDTFEDTLTNEDYEQILRNLPSRFTGFVTIT